MSISTTTQDLVTGKKVAIVHAVVDSGTSTTTRTVIMPAARDDLTVTVEGEDTDFTPAAQYQTKRFMVSGTIDIEMSMPFSSDLSNFEQLGIVASDGSLNIQGDEASIGFGQEEEYLEWIYFDHEPDFQNMSDIEQEAELINRFGKVKFNNPELDASEAPPMVSLGAWVEGDVYYGFSSGGTP